MLAVESQRLCFCFGEIELVWPHLALPRPICSGDHFLPKRLVRKCVRRVRTCVLGVCAGARGGVMAKLEGGVGPIDLATSKTGPSKLSALINCARPGVG